MRIRLLLISCSILSALTTSLHAQQYLPLGASPVAITYTCPTQTGSLPTCSTTYVLPEHSLLVIQSVSGSATPINPNAAGTFATGQASLTITTQLTSDPSSAVANIVGPNYALANSAIWFFNTPTTLYSRFLPTVMNNGGSVFLQGYVFTR